MRHYMYFLFLGVMMSGMLVAQETPVPEKNSLVTVFFNSDYTMEDFSDCGFDPECTRIKEGCLAETILNESQIGLLKQKNAKFDILIDDMSEWYDQRNKGKNTLDRIQSDPDFKYGSMGGFFTLEEIYSEYDSLIAAYPQYFLGADTIGYSYQSRPMIAYSFGSSSDSAAGLMINSLIHAREPGGMMSTLYFMKKALRLAAGGDPEFGFLFENRKLYLIPVMNPDGYKYNQTTKPDGGGTWRKNRDKTTDSTYGVDLNRNFGPYDFWNAPNNGSSTSLKSETYRGATPFSEPETNNLRKFTMKHNIKLAVNYHTYGGHIIHPYAALVAQTPDSSVFRALTWEFSRYNRYNCGLDAETVGYSTRGDSDDWFYETDSSKSKVFAMTPEIGNDIDGFWPKVDRIPVHCDEMFYMNKQVLWSANVNLRIKDYYTESNTDSLKSWINITMINAGVQKADSESEMTLVPLSDAFTVKDNKRMLGKLSPAERQTEVFEVLLTGKAFENGAGVPFEVTVLQEGLLRKDTITVKMFIYEDLWIFRDGELAHKWENSSLGTWDTFFDAANMKFVLTDSPSGKSKDSADCYFTMKELLDIPANDAVLEYFVKWSLEWNYDKFIIQAIRPGADWKNLVADRMIDGFYQKGSRIDSAEKVYTGSQPEWIRQQCDMKEYVNRYTYLRFGVLTDRYTSFDGVFLDNVRIKYYRDLDYYSVEDPAGNSVVSIYPNPVPRGSNALLAFGGVSPAMPATVTITDAIGRTVFTGRVNADENGAVTYYTVESSGFIPGIYFLNLGIGSQSHSLKFIVIE